MLSAPASAPDSRMSFGSVGYDSSTRGAPVEVTPNAAGPRPADAGAASAPPPAPRPPPRPPPPPPNPPPPRPAPPPPAAAAGGGPSSVVSLGAPDIGCMLMLLTPAMLPPPPPRPPRPPPASPAAAAGRSPSANTGLPLNITAIAFWS